MKINVWITGYISDYLKLQKSQFPPDFHEMRNLSLIINAYLLSFHCHLAASFVATRCLKWRHLHLPTASREAQHSYGAARGKIIRVSFTSHCHTLTKIHLNVSFEYVSRFRTGRFPIGSITKILQFFCLKTLIYSSNHL